MILTSAEWMALWLSVKAATVGLAVILLPGIGVAWALTKSNWRFRALLDTFVKLPLVLPPVVSGYVLLLAFSKRGPVGGALNRLFGWEILFTWQAAALAVSVVSFPLLVQGIAIAMNGIDAEFETSARSLGASPFRVFWTITLPLSMRGVVGGAIMAFCRGLGEFGATVMVAGNIPGKTQTAPSAIFTYVQIGQDEGAFRLVLALTVVSFVALRIAESRFKSP